MHFRLSSATTFFGTLKTLPSESCAHRYCNSLFNAEKSSVRYENTSPGCNVRGMSSHISTNAVSPKLPPMLVKTTGSFPMFVTFQQSHRLDDGIAGSRTTCPT